MSLLRLVVLLLVLGIGVHGAPAQAQEMASYYETTDFLAAPAGVFREGLLGVSNPATPALTGNQFVFTWATDGTDAASVGDWAALGSVGGLGVGVVRRAQAGLATTGVNLSLAGGSKTAAVGIGYQRFGGDATALGRFNRLTAGTLLRPSRYLSLGLAGNVSVENDEREVVGEIGVRPLGTSRLTLFADAAWEEGQALVDVPWSVGANVEVARGVDLVGRLFSTDAATAGLRVELGRLGLDSQSRVNAAGDYSGQIHRVRLGAPAPSALADAVQRGGQHVETRLDGRVAYRGPEIAFGDETPRFYEVLRTLRQAEATGRVGAVALNLSGLQVAPEQAWEIREAIRAVQAQGTPVVVFLDGGGMTTMHLASAADRVVLDPRATLQLPGYALSRTYLKGTLDKLGIGFQEWRFFEYKSAAEVLSRTEFSEADSLQRQQYVNDQYALATEDIVDARPIEADTLDRIIDERVILTAEEAQHTGLVDTLARWHERQDLLRDAAGTETDALDPDRLNAIATATRRWGQPPQIAVVYGIGGTQLDRGIEARRLRETFRELAEDDDVAAIVFRVDSPGGSGLAADQVAEALKTAADTKPVIVSQGQVAASGGYWISAYADRILAGPNTVTGSIGVIGGWAYDAGFGEKTGLSSDAVKRGERADLFTGITLPLAGVTLPTRPLTDDELQRVRDVFLQLYDDFVQVVAEGRDTTAAHVREIGEGRIYSGRDGQRVGLVDEIGGLARAITVAQDAAGLAGEDVEITEVNPTTGLFDLPPFVPGALARLWADDAPEVAAPLAQDDALQFLRTVLQHQPRPVALLPPGYYPSNAEFGPSRAEFGTAD
jgi:protease-4